MLPGLKGLRGCAGSPGSPALLPIGCMGAPVPQHGVTWGHWALLGATGSGLSCRGGLGNHSPSSSPHSVPTPVPGATDSPAELCGARSSTGERGNLLKQANCNDSPFPSVSRFGGERSK